MRLDVTRWALGARHTRTTRTGQSIPTPPVAPQPQPQHNNSPSRSPSPSCRHSTDLVAPLLTPLPLLLLIYHAQRPVCVCPPQEPRKWQISRAGGIEGVVRSMMANPGSQVVQHRGTQILRNLHTQLTDWAHKHRTEVAEVRCRDTRHDTMRRDMTRMHTV
jgi:hypothetical protein